jgi:membrane protease YdiL (CAAX protease family)
MPLRGTRRLKPTPTFPNKFVNELLTENASPRVGTKRYRLGLREATAFAIVATIAAGIWFWDTTHQLKAALLIVCPGLAFTAMLWIGSDHVLERLERWVHAQPARVMVFPTGLWLLYLTYAAGMGIADIRSGLTMAAYLALPFLALGFKPKLEPLVILWLWLPLELGIIRNILSARMPGMDVHYVLAQLLAIDAGIIAFAVWSKTPGIGYRFEADRKILASGLIHFVLFAATAIPLGLAIGFIRYSFTTSKLYAAPLIFIGVFFFTALPEEFLFRGLIQNWIERMTRRQVVSLVSASVIFGASHLNNGPPVPNYKYFLMASIAGLFYGRAWRDTGSLMASSITHALVDTFWSVIFR